MLATRLFARPRALFSAFLTAIGAALLLAILLLSIAPPAAGSPNPVPFVDIVSPVSIIPGATGITITLWGAGFVPASVVKWNGTTLTTTFVSARELTATVPDAFVAAVGLGTITIVSPPTGGGVSNVSYIPVAATLAGTNFPSTPSSSVVVGAAPTGIATGDFNGDGKIDLAVANSTDNNVSILQGNGNGTFTARPNVPTGNGPHWVVTGDFNEDGKLDLAVVNTGSATVSVLLGNGDGTFTLLSSPATGPAPFAIASADFNADGHLDLAVTNASNATVTILLGNGNGTFTPGTSPAVGNSPQLLVVGDFNEDGILDLAVSNEASNTVSMLLGNGDGTFQTQVTTSVGGTGFPIGLISGDFNGDTHLDVVAVNASDIGILLGSGTGTLTLGSNPTAGSNLISGVTGDYNGDGKLDIVVVDQTLGQAFLFPGIGNGTFSSAIAYTTASGTYNAVTADFNGDGALDLSFTNNGANNVSIFLQTLPVSLAPASLSFGNQLVGTSSSPQIVTLTNNTGGTLNISAITIAGTNSGDFSRTTTCGATVPNTGTCTISVTFSPSALGSRVATLNVTDNASNSPQTLGLSGTGVASPATITKAFGAATIPLNGSTSLTFSITNPNTASSLSGIAFTDTLPSGLVVATPGNLISTCSGTPTVVDGSGSLSLSGGFLAPSTSCTVSVAVTGTTAGVKNNSVQITSTEGGIGNTSNASVTVIAPPVIIKAFGAASIPLNGSTSLTFTIQNNNTTQSLSAVAFSDTLPAGLVLSTPNGLTGSCGGGAITATQATNIISLSGATLAQSSSCTFSVNVTGTAAGQQNNTTSNVTSTEGGTGGTASASINVVAPPSIAKVFNPTAIPVAGTTSLTFTITNPSANTVALTGVAFTDTIPTGLTITNSSSVVCGGTLTTTAPTGIALAGATIAINVPCSFSVTVTGAAAGQYANTTGGVSSTNGGTGNTASANLSVAASPAIAKAFGAATVPLNGTTTLTFTLNNPNAALTLTGIAFTDSFPSGLVISSPNGLTGTCGGGTITATAGSSSVTLTGANLSPAASCNFSLNVTGITVGPQSNTTGPASSTQSGNGATSNTATLTVLGPPSITKSFGASSIALGANTSLTFSISNPNATTSLTGVAITDTLPAGLVVATPSGVTGTCGSGTITAGAGTTDINLSGGTIPVNSSCNFSVNVTGTAAGTQVNTTGVVSSTNAGNGNTATASLTVIPPDLTISKSHTGNFTQSQVGAAYTLTVNNGGLAPTLGTVTVTDTLPTGLTATAMSGNGWTCVLSNLSCTRSDALASSASFPPITLTVTVAFNAAPSIVNTATVSGGGETTTVNDTVTDTTNVNQVIDLGIAKSHAASFYQGQSGAAYAITVTNVAGTASSGVVTVVDTLPPSLTATAMAGNGWSCTVGTLTCTRSDSLGVGASYAPITLTVNVAASAPASVTNTAVISGGGDSNNVNNTATDPTIVTPPPDFSITASPTSATVRAGHGGSYTLTLTPVNQPFTNPITFTAAGLPLKSAFVVTPVSVTPGATAATCEAVIFTVSGDTFTGQLVPRRSAPLAAAIPITGLLLGFGFRRKLLRQAFRTRALLLFLLLACSLLGYGCAGSARNFPLLGTTPGTYSVTITGTSGAIQHSTTVTLTVTP